MVLRKETPPQDLVPPPLSHAVNNPPYPVTPTSEHPPILPSSTEVHEPFSPDLTTSPAFRLQPLEQAPPQQKDEDSSDYSDDDWDRSDDEQMTPEDHPEHLITSEEKKHETPDNVTIPSKDTLPDVLRAGPPPGVAVKKSLDQISPEPTGATAASYGAESTGSASSAPFQTNNPYLRMQSTGQSNYGEESSAHVWGGVPTAAEKYGEPVELPAMQTPASPSEGFSTLGLNNDAPPKKGPSSPHQPPLMAVESPTPPSAHPKQDTTATHYQESSQGPWQELQAWDKTTGEDNRQDPGTVHSGAVGEEQERPHGHTVNQKDETAQVTTLASPSNDIASAQPLRPLEEEHSPPKPPRPVDTMVSASTRPDVESPGTAIRKQRNQTYQIRKVRWYDCNKQGIRTSPVLTQNENGPCPLLALVNALVLSTPDGVESGLVDALRSREQVSLGLLLDAVFDELMSGRRGGAAQELPDVSELYKFLLGLHTGMNVNPVFVQDPDATDGALDLIPSLAVKAGVFTNTPEMKFYRTFNIPLIHGWLPAPGSEAYRAFERTAKTFEDAQLVQFQEEELEAKLSTTGLSADEQRLYTDVQAIKDFLLKWPTQLSDEGLNIIRQRLQPGQVGILFRNDHFSTLYKDPRTENLVTLVTDAGYATHDEIVWESLVDVTGQGSELFSGDFRPVGNSAPQRPQGQQQLQSMLDVGDEQGWTTVPARRRNRQGEDGTASTPEDRNATWPSSNLSQAEQEDHDLALALQLQEEEEDRHRREQEERRRRENGLTEPGNRQPIRPGDQPPPIPPRRNYANQVTTHRPSNEPAPPPTYEEAAQRPAYHPPQTQLPGLNTPVRPLQNQQGGSPYQAHNPAIRPAAGAPGPTGRRRSSRPMGMNQFTPARPGRPQGAGVAGSNSEDKERCIVM